MSFNVTPFKEFQMSLNPWMRVFIETTLNWLLILHMEEK